MTGSGALKTIYNNLQMKQLLPWAVAAMENSHAPYSREKCGVLIRTMNGEIAVGSRLETMNYDGLEAVEVALGSLFANAPWLDSANKREILRDVLVMLPAINVSDPDSYALSGRALEWMRKFGHEDTKVLFATPEGVRRQCKLKNLLPHCRKLPGIENYAGNTASFYRYLETEASPPEGVSALEWRDIRRARLNAFAPSSTYRVGTAVYPDLDTVPEARKAEILQMMKRMDHSLYHEGQSLDEIFRDHEDDFLLRELLVFRGVNVELSDNDGLHGEACAVGSMKTALGADVRAKKLLMMGGIHNDADKDHMCTVCGKCRQLLVDVASPDMEIILMTPEHMSETLYQKDSLPGTFRFES